MIYWFDEIDEIDKDMLEYFDTRLICERRNIAQSFVFERDRASYTSAFMLLRYALENEYGIREKPELEYSKYGKPYLKDCRNIFFSISHCRKGVLCSLSHCETGADIQDYDERLLSVNTNPTSSY